MKKFVIQAIVLIVVIFGGLYFSFKSTNLFTGPAQTTQTPTSSSKVAINDLLIDVEIADTPEKRQKGLGGRVSLASNSGMLFIFDKPDRLQFWMKGLSFPLDFLWIKQGSVVDITRNVPPPEPNQKDETLPIYVPNQPVNAVLEVNAGFADAHGIKVGDKIELRQ